MKTLLRENRQPRGSVAKIERILKELRSNPPPRRLVNPSGAKLFAVWKAHKASRRTKQNSNNQPVLPREYAALIEKYRSGESR